MKGCKICDGSGWLSSGKNCPSCNHDHSGCVTAAWNGENIPNGWERVKEITQ